MSNMNLELQLKLQDRMSAGMKAALQAMQRETKNSKKEFDGLNKAANSIKPTGIERMIKSMNTLKSTAKSTLDVLNKAAQTGAAIGAGAYVAKRALDKPMAYDRQLALTSNVAFSDRSAAGRIAGKMELDKAVRNAQQQGLGSQEEVLNTLNQLIGSGAMGAGQAGVKSSMDMLPTITKASSGTGADPADIAKIVMAAKQNMGMTDAEIKRFLSQSITAGGLGGFELKDIARYLPEQMASYAANGGKGMKGAEDLLAYNQVSRITAGNSDQAGNNMVNLLSKINSPDTIKDFQKQGIDLTGSLTAARGKGIGGLDAFMSLVDKVASKDPAYKKLQTLAAKQEIGEQKQTFEAMMNIMEQKGLGAVVQDRQAMAAMLGARQQKTKLNEVRNAVRADTGGQVEANFKTVDSTVSASGERLANAKDAAASGSLASMTGPLQAMLKGITSVSIAHPILATAAYTAATALGALAAMSGVGGLFKVGKGAAGAVTGAAGRGLIVKAGALAIGMAPAAAAVGAAGIVGYGAGSVINKGINAVDNKFGTGIGDSIGQAISIALAAFGNKQAKQNLQVNLHIDGRQISTVVETQQRKHYGRS